MSQDVTRCHKVSHVDRADSARLKAGCTRQAHSALKWDDRLAKLSGQEGFVVQHDKVPSSGL